MFIPEKIQVGYMVYGIEVTGQPIILNNRQCTGMIDYEQGEIKLADASVQGKYARHQTFWHEVFHAFGRERGLKFEDEELVVDELGKAMAAFCIDNKLEFRQEEEHAALKHDNL